ncbi:hypothetical protein [Streptomyces hundungensis]|nr:hypothetical protein [Streptomyces hundungensis]
MGWVGPEYIPIRQQDHRYARLLKLTRRLLEERVPRCGNRTGGAITIRDDQGNQTTVQCSNCQGTGETGTLPDNEDNGRAAGER